MFYAHEGSRYDNAFPLGIDNKPTRIFRAFDTKKQREACREKVWANGRNNLIDCGRKLVEKYLGKNFGACRTGDGDSFLCANRNAYDQHQYEVELSGADS